MSKQTAVEWLIGMISYTSKDTHSAMESSNFFDKAIAMEREQIEHAFDAGVDDGMKVDKDYEYPEFADGETYYEANYEEASHEA